MTINFFKENHQNWWLTTRAIIIGGQVTKLLESAIGAVALAIEPLKLATRAVSLVTKLLAMVARI